MGRLDGSVAIITGAARGQGAAEARLFVEAGASVVVGDILDEIGETLVAELGDAAIYCHLDVTEPGDWAKALGVAKERGPVRVLVNNAGVHRRCALDEETLETFMTMISVNLAGAFLGMQAVLPEMRAAGGGSIVNVSSIIGMRGGGGLVAYSSSKWALRGLTRSAALELGPEGIRVNSIHPGPIDTPMMRRAPGQVDDVPLRRLGTPEEVARLALFLASDDSSFMTGTETVIDGGVMAGDARAFRPVRS